MSEAVALAVAVGGRQQFHLGGKRERIQRHTRKSDTDGPHQEMADGEGRLDVLFGKALVSSEL